MRQEHRQGTGFFRHLPLFFAILGLFAGGLVTAARGAEEPGQPAGQPSVPALVSEDLADDALLEMYFEWLLRQMKVPVQANASVHELAHAFVRAFEAKGTPDLKPLVAVQFVSTLLLTETLLLTHEGGLEPAIADQVLQVIDQMLVDLGQSEGRVAE